MTKMPKMKEKQMNQEESDTSPASKYAIQQAQKNTSNNQPSTKDDARYGNSSFSKMLMLENERRDQSDIKYFNENDGGETDRPQQNFKISPFAQTMNENSSSLMVPQPTRKMNRTPTENLINRLESAENHEIYNEDLRERFITAFRNMDIKGQKDVSAILQNIMMTRGGGASHQNMSLLNQTVKERNNFIS